MLAGLRLTKEVGVKKLKAYSESQLVTEQISREYQAKDPQLAKYLAKVKELGGALQEFLVC